MSKTPTAFDAKPDRQATASNRVREWLAEKQQRFAEIDEQLVARLHEATEELKRQSQEKLQQAQTQRQLVEQENQLALHRTAAEKQAALLEQLLAQVQQLDSDLHQPPEITPAEAAANPELVELSQRLEDRRREVELQAAELARRNDNLEHRERETELQRKNISRQLWARKAELLAEVERMRAEAVAVHSGEEMQSQVRLAEELARTERLQSDVRRTEQQVDDARKLITDLRSDLERERLLAREQEHHRRGVEDERVTLTAEVERLRVTFETISLQRATLEEELQLAQEEVERLRTEALKQHSGEELQSQVRLAEETARAERLQAEIRRLEQQADDTRRLVADMRSDLDRERSLAREQEQRRRTVEDERVLLTAEVERLRVTSETFAQQRTKLEEDLQRYREQADRQVNDLRNDQGKAFDEHLQQLFTQIDNLTRERQRAIDEQAASQDLARGLEAAAIGLRSETRRLEEELKQVRVKQDEELKQARGKQAEELKQARVKQEEELKQLHSTQAEELQQLREELNDDRKQFESARKELEQQVEALEQTATQLEETIAELRSQAAIPPSANDQPSEETLQELAELRDQLAGLQLEHDQLERQLLEAQEAAEAAGDSNSGTADEDLQRRLEMAVDEVRELRAKNQDLTDKLSQRPAQAASSSGGSSNSWEEQKRRLMEQLENDYDEKDPQQKADKLTVSGAIRITDQVVADKEREIEELQRLLENQSNSIGNVAVGASAIAQVLEQDELIMQERQNLQELKDTLQDKLRKAEVEISVERAKLGREKQELEEKLRSFELERSKAGVVENGNSAPAGKQQRGAWLTRLGLKDKDVKDGK